MLLKILHILQSFNRRSVRASPFTNFRLLFGILPGLLFLMIAPWTPEIDFATSNFFYRGGHFVPGFLAEEFFKYGFLPADILAIGSLILFLGSFCFSDIKHLRAPTLALALGLALGSGLITHAILKDHWGRPRPVQTIPFGGSMPFRPFYSPDINPKIPAKSFPCGHCSTGFYFFSLALVGKRHEKKSIKYLGFGLAFFLGIFLSYTRISQGGHFFSDTIASALVMWWTALLLDWLIYRNYKKLGC